VTTPTLRRGSTGRGVAVLQGQLAELGRDVRLSGLFGDQTDRVVRAFQDDQEIGVDGDVGPLTRATLTAARSARAVPALASYRGAWGFLLDEEGIDDESSAAPHWPGGLSGVTLRGGLDLGQLERGNPLPLHALYGGPLLGREPLSDVELDALELSLGVRGNAARELCLRPVLAAVRIPLLAAADVVPRLAAAYWRDVVRACPAVLEPTTPRGAHTALLSLTFNAGADALTSLREPAGRERWDVVAVLLAAKNQTTPALAGRRAREAELFS
jgi:hypothetical protein